MNQNGGKVFVSHCSIDREQANGLADALQAHGISAWIAPRDVQAGRDYSEQVDEALAGAAAVVVVASPAYADSLSAMSEAQQAASLGKPLYPVRVADSPAGLASLAGARFLTDAFGPHAERNVGRLAEELQAETRAAPAAPAPPEPAATPPAPEPAMPALEPAPVVAAAPVPPPAAAPAPAPVAAAPVMAEAAAPAAAPSAAMGTTEAPPPAAPPGSRKGRNILFGLLGVAMVIVGLARMSDGLRGIFGSSRSSSGHSTSYGGSAAADDSWLVAQWSAQNGNYCANWIRFNSDHTMIDNANNSGTWSLSGSNGAYTLTMNSAVTGARSGAVTYDGEMMIMGSGPGSVGWRRAVC